MLVPQRMQEPATWRLSFRVSSFASVRDATIDTLALRGGGVFDPSPNGAVFETAWNNPQSRSWSMMFSARGSQLGCLHASSPGQEFVEQVAGELHYEPSEAALAITSAASSSRSRSVSGWPISASARRRRFATVLRWTPST